MSKSRNYSTAKSQHVQFKMSEGLSKDKANRDWSKSGAREEFEYNQSGSNSRNESDFDADLNSNGTNWHTSEDL